jgi:hypothetical protein
MRKKTKFSLSGAGLSGAGEKHAYLYTGSKSSNILGLEKGSYIGPGTRLTQRLLQNSKPKTYSDTVAQAHDIRYGLSQNTSDIRKADEKMLKSLEKAKREKLDYKFNIIQGEVGIKSKIFLEDKIGIKPEFFTDFGIDNLNSSEIKLYRNKLNELELQGFGHRNMCRF